MTERINFSSGAVWEDTVGYSRAVKIKDMIFISGTVAVDNEGNVVGKGSAYKQTKFIIEKISKALIELDAGLINVVRTRIFVTDINKWEEIGKAHGEFFSDIKPATSMIEVNKLISSEYLLEIEVDAVL